MLPGRSTNRNQTAGLPPSPRFSQRPTTDGSAARACGTKAANATNADKASAVSFAVTLEILPIRQIDQSTRLSRPIIWPFHERRGAILRNRRAKMRLPAEGIVRQGRRNAFLADVLSGSN